MERSQIARWLRLVLLALLPAMLAAMWNFAKFTTPIMSVVGINSGGDRVVYTESIWDPLGAQDPGNTVVRPDLVIRRPGGEIRTAVTITRPDAVALSSDQRLLVIGEPGNYRCAIF